MSHSVTCKLNKDARQFANQNGVTFFVSLGEKNYNFKTKQSEYTNYEAALFAKDAQIQFYTDALREGSVVEVKGAGILLEMPDDPQYKPKLVIQDAKLGFVHTAQQVPQQQNRQQPQQRPPQGNQGQRTQQQPQQGNQGQQQRAPQQRQAPQPQQQYNNQPPAEEGWDDSMQF
jgi:hypothetical protein